MEDITDTLEITVFDENRRTKHDFLGKVWRLDCDKVDIDFSLQVVIPLLNIEHGQKKWFKLKEKNKQEMTIIAHLVVLTAQNHQRQVTWTIKKKKLILEETSDNVNQVEAIQKHT